MKKNLTKFKISTKKVFFPTETIFRSFNLDVNKTEKIMGLFRQVAAAADPDKGTITIFVLKMVSCFLSFLPNDMLPLKKN